MVTQGRRIVYNPTTTRWRQTFVFCVKCKVLVLFASSDLTAAGCPRLAVSTRLQAECKIPPLI